MPIYPHKKNFFELFFPPPLFLLMPAMGLDISTNSVRFLELVRSKEGLQLGRFGERKIPEGAGYSEEVHSNKELTDVLSKLKEEYKLKFVHVSLPEEKAYLFQTALPEMGESEVRETIELQLEENVPLSGAEAIFDYTVMKKHEKGHTDVAVSVLPKKVVESFSQLFKNVGLIPLTFQLGAEALTRSVIKNGDLETYMIVNFGEKKTGIYIVQEGLVHFTATLNFGGEALTSGIQKLFSVSREEAITIKKGTDFIKNKENMKLFFSLLNPISALKDEVNRLYIYWNNHKNIRGETNKQIKKIILCGSDSNLQGFDEYLTLTLRIETEVANVWVNLFSFDGHIPELSFLDSLNYPTVIGLSL